MNSRGEGGAWSSFAYGAALAATFMVAILAMCALAALVGLLLTSLGIVSLEQLTSPAMVITAVLAMSVVLSVFMCVAINCTLVRPIRRMTEAMGHLARGDFGFRMERSKRFNLREVNDFVGSFNTAAGELASTEMMRSSFISDFSHEFRTPISSLSGFAQLLMDDGLSPEERREYAGIIVDESSRLAGLSERILLLSKVEAATILPNAETVNVAEQIRRTVALLEPRLSEGGVSVSLSLDEAEVRGNADYLAQLWLNLLDNAVKFSPQGGRVSVALYGGLMDEGDAHASGAGAAFGAGLSGDAVEGDAVDGVVAGVAGAASSAGSAGAGSFIVASRAAREVVVWVSDEGCGMDSETQAHIFNRFYQGDSSHAVKGSGLGLALCKRIAELHGGTIDVQSAPGKGSVFEVGLPRERRIS